MTDKLETRIDRILGNTRVIADEDTLGNPVRCIRCKDTGLIEYVGGEHLTLAADGRLGSRKVTATPEKPIYKRCACLDERPAAPEARRTFSASR